jgi:hypothetical protein
MLAAARFSQSLFEVADVQGGHVDDLLRHRTAHRCLLGCSYTPTRSIYLMMFYLS